jgi:hypothetical protein
MAKAAINAINIQYIHSKQENSLAGKLLIALKVPPANCQNYFNAKSWPRENT